MNKPDQFRILILTIILLLIIYDVLMLCLNKQNHLSENNK